METTTTTTTTSKPRARTDDRRRRSAPFVAGAGLLILTAVAYLPVLDAGFVWDDDDYVTGNPLLGSADGLQRIWADTSATPQYYPLTHTSFWVEHRLWELDPTGYHVDNVLLHAVAAILFWRILLLLGVRGAWLGAALFALHPVQVESVAWITERKNVLAGALYMGAALAWLRFALVCSTRAWRSYVLSTVLFVAALLAKTIAATLPFALLLILWWKRERGDPALRRGTLSLVPLAVAGIGLGLHTAWLERVQIGAVGAEWSLTWLDRFWLAAKIPWFYLGKLVLPINLSFVYHRWEPGPAVWPLAGLVAAVGLVWLVRWRGRGAIVPFAYFVLTLGPALGLVNVYPMRYSWVADHFQYLACAGPLALAGMLLGLAGDRVSGRLARRVLIAVPLLALGLLTFQQSRAYHDLETLWRHTLARNPGAWIAHNNLGAMLGQRGEWDAAASHLEQAIALKPDHAGAHENLGLVLSGLGDGEGAIASFRVAARLETADAGKQARLGEALAATGRFGEAIEAFERASALEPNDPTVLQALGIALARSGRAVEAVEPLGRAAELQPTADGYYNLARALAVAGRRDEALAALDRALQIDPDHGPSQRARASMIGSPPG